MNQPHEDQHPPWKSIMDTLQKNELAHQASIDQQRENLRYVTTLHEWLQVNVQELQGELVSLSDSVKQLRREALLQKSSAQCTPSVFSCPPAPVGPFVPFSPDASTPAPLLATPPGFVPTGFMSITPPQCSVTPQFPQATVPTYWPFTHNQGEVTSSPVVATPPWNPNPYLGWWPVVPQANPPLQQQPHLALPTSVHLAPPPINYLAHTVYDSYNYLSPDTSIQTPNPTSPVPLVMVDPPTRPTSHSGGGQHIASPFIPTHLSRITEQTEMFARTASTVSSRSATPSVHVLGEEDRGRPRKRATPRSTMQTEYCPSVSSRSSSSTSRSRTPPRRMRRSPTPMPRSKVGRDGSYHSQGYRVHSQAEQPRQYYRPRRSRTPIRVSVNPTIIVCNGGQGCSHSTTPVKSTQSGLGMPSPVPAASVLHSRSRSPSRTPSIVARRLSRSPSAPRSIPDAPATRLPAFLTQNRTCAGPRPLVRQDRSASGDTFIRSPSPKPPIIIQMQSPRPESPPTIRCAHMGTPPLPLPMQRTSSSSSQAASSGDSLVLEVDMARRLSLTTPPSPRASPVASTPWWLSSAAGSDTLPSSRKSLAQSENDHTLDSCRHPVPSNATHDMQGLTPSSIVSSVLPHRVSPWAWNPCKVIPSYPSQASPMASPYTSHVPPTSVAPPPELVIPPNPFASHSLLSPPLIPQGHEMWAPPPPRSSSTTPNVIQVSLNQYPSVSLSGVEAPSDHRRYPIPPKASTFGGPPPFLPPPWMRPVNMSTVSGEGGSTYMPFENNGPGTANRNSWWL
jgi:hypothetical protein